MRVEFDGPSGNVFAVVAQAERVMRNKGVVYKSGTIVKRLNAEAKDYNAALDIINEYVTISNIEEGYQ